VLDSGVLQLIATIVKNAPAEIARMIVLNCLAEELIGISYGSFGWLVIEYFFIGENATLLSIAKLMGD
jgi:hypothetical protein